MSKATCYSYAFKSSLGGVDGVHREWSFKAQLRTSLRNFGFDLVPEEEDVVSCSCSSLLSFHENITNVSRDS